MRSRVIAVGAALFLSSALVAPTSHASRLGEPEPTTITVPATANIFGAGVATPPAPAGEGAGTPPPSFSISLPVEDPELEWVVRAGKVTCCNTEDPIPYNDPEGTSRFSTNLNGVGGISSIQWGTSMFLAGVFLGSSQPTQAPPPLDAVGGVELGQIFSVGQSGFISVPEGATRLFLGFADGNGFQGDPGYYKDNDGSFSIDIWYSDLAECEDGSDNDDDGLTDYPDDPECGFEGDDYEQLECLDLVNNDGDEFVDYPDDPGCEDEFDDSESPDPEVHRGFHERSITVGHRTSDINRDRLRISGQLALSHSTFMRCVRNVGIQIFFRSDGGDPTRLATAETNTDGRFAVTVKRREALYIAKAPKLRFEHPTEDRIDTCLETRGNTRVR